MATQHDPSTTDEQMFHMPESAYERLLAVRDQLRLLAALIQPHTRAEENTLREVPPTPLAHEITLVAGQLDDVLDSVE